jgi:hypothetical protein
MAQMLTSRKALPSPFVFPRKPPHQSEALLMSFFAPPGWSLILLLFAITPAAAQSPQSSEPARVMVVGTYHFANPGLDMVQVEVDDVLSDHRQAEIRELVEALAAFRPTKIAVEQVPATGALLDSLLRAYRAGTHELSRSEFEQVGFRLATQLNHERVFPIDHHGEFPIGPVMQYAAVHAPAFIGALQQEIGRLTAEENRRQRELTIGQILRLTNDPQELAADHGRYLSLARVGAGDTYVGADLLSKWYDRNIRIHTNLQRIAGPGDRVLVIIGTGHVPILRELITSDPEMTLVEALTYLPAR